LKPHPLPGYAPRPVVNAGSRDEAWQQGEPLSMTLPQVIIRLSSARLRAVAAELGVDGLEEAPDAAVMEIVLDRLAERALGVDWVLARVPAGEVPVLPASN